MITFDDLKALAAISGPCLSIFQPMRDEFSQVTKAGTRVTGAAQRADALLAAKGYDARAREEFLKPIFKVAENTDWTARTGSMVLFRAPDFTQAIFWPDALDPKVRLSGDFFILPLLAGVSAQRTFSILALGIKHIRLFRGDAKQLTEAALPKDLPRSLREATGFDQPDHDLESRTAPGAATGQIAAVRSGTDTLQEKQHDYVRDFFRKIDRAIRPLLADGRNPLIVAAVERELSIYRQVNSYPGLLIGAIHGNPDALGEERLHKEAIQLVAANAASAREETRREMDRAAGRGLLLTDLAAIEQAAGVGQIDRLFIESSPAANEDRINAAALAVIRNSGSVVGCEPLETSVAAILRYRVAEAPLPRLAAQRA